GSACGENEKKAVSISKEHNPEKLLDSSNTVQFKLHEKFYQVKLPLGAFLDEEDGGKVIIRLDPDHYNSLELVSHDSLLPEIPEFMSGQPCKIHNWVKDIKKYNCYGDGKDASLFRYSGQGFYAGFNPAGPEVDSSEYKIYIGITESIKPLN